MFNNYVNSRKKQSRHNCPTNSSIEYEHYLNRLKQRKNRAIALGKVHQQLNYNVNEEINDNVHEEPDEKFIPMIVMIIVLTCVRLFIGDWSFTGLILLIAVLLIWYRKFCELNIFDDI